MSRGASSGSSVTKPTASREKAFWRRAAAWGAQKGPGWFARGAPSLIGVFFALVSATARRAVLRNQRLIHGRRAWGAESRAVIQTFVNFSHALTAALAPQRPLFRDRKVVTLGGEQVKPFIEAKQGILFVTAHVGPWDLAAMKLRGLVDAPVMMLMSGEAETAAADFQDSVRQDEDVKVLRVGRTALDALPLFEHLKAGGIVVSQIDRVPAGAPHVDAPLFGEAFRLPQGLFRLAGALGCPLVPVLSAREPSGDDTVRVTAPLSVPRRPTDEQTSTLAKEVAKRLEDHLRVYSTQWYHFSS